MDGFRIRIRNTVIGTVLTETFAIDQFLPVPYRDPMFTGDLSAGEGRGGGVIFIQFFFLAKILFGVRSSGSGSSIFGRSGNCYKYKLFYLVIYDLIFYFREEQMYYC